MLLTVRKWLAYRWSICLAAVLLAALVGLAGWYAWGEYHHRAAERAFDRHDDRLALHHLDRYFKVRPGDARAHLLAARAARRLRLYRRAEEHLRACSRQGHDPHAVALEWTLQHVQQGDLRAEPQLRSLVEAGDPNVLFILEVLIQEYVQSYRLLEAKDGLDRYLARRPADLHALLGRGFVLEKLFYYREAAEDYRRAVRLAPDDLEPRRRLARVLDVLGPPEKAREQYRWLLERQPDEAGALLGLARSCRKLGELAESRRHLARLLALRPDDAAALAERGQVALDEGDAAEAEPWLRRAVQHDPYDRTAHDALYRCLRQQAKEAEAQQIGQRLNRLNADLKRLDRLLTVEVPRAPHDPALRCEAGTLFLRNGQEAEGVRWLHLALQCGPRFGPAHRELAAYYKRKGQLDCATRHRRLAGNSSR